MGQRREESLIQELVSQPPIEAFDEGVLDRLARCDVVPFHLGPIRPLQDRVAGELATIAPTEGRVGATEGTVRAAFLLQARTV